MKLTGGCQCGNIRFVLESEPILVYTCHCTDCQKQSSSAFGISAWVERSQFTLQKGVPGFWNTVAESGNNKLCAFCSLCGSRIYHALGGDDQILSIKGGAIDDAAKLKPVAHIWMRSAQQWVKKLFSYEPQFETEPDSFEELKEIYRKQMP